MPDEMNALSDAQLVAHVYKLLAYWTEDVEGAGLYWLTLHPVVVEHLALLQAEAERLGLADVVAGYGALLASVEEDLAAGDEEPASGMEKAMTALAGAHWGVGGSMKAAVGQVERVADAVGRVFFEAGVEGYVDGGVERGVVIWLWRVVLWHGQWLVAYDSENAQYRGQLGHTAHNLGVVYAEQGDYEQAVVYYELALEHRQWLLVDDRDNAKYRERLGDTAHNLGFVYREQGDAEQAVVYSELALAQWQWLVADDPDNAKYREGLGDTAYNLGVVCDEQGDYEQAVVYYELALAQRQWLVADDPDNAKYREGLGATAHNLGVDYGKQGDYEQAVVYYELALAQWQWLVADDPDNAKYREDLGQTALGLAQAQCNCTPRRIAAAETNLRLCLSAPPSQRMRWHALTLQAVIAHYQVNRPSPSLNVVDTHRREQAYHARCAEAGELLERVHREMDAARATWPTSEQRIHHLLDHELAYRLARDIAYEHLRLSRQQGPSQVVTYAEVATGELVSVPRGRVLEQAALGRLYQVGCYRGRATAERIVSRVKL